MHFYAKPAGATQSNIFDFKHILLIPLLVSKIVSYWVTVYLKFYYKMFKGKPLHCLV